MTGDQSKSPPREKPIVHERGLVTRGLGTVAAGLSAGLLAIMLSVLIECVGIALKWWPNNHAENLLISERSYIEAIDQYPMTALSPQSVSHQAASRLDDVWRGIWQAPTINLYLLAVINTLKLLMLRSAICVFVLPGFLLVSIAAFCDGLVARDIRKYSGGHESSYVFHKAKRWIVPALLLTVSIYLVLPFSIPPVVIFAPSMLLTGAMIYIATSRFKKYL